LHKFVPDYPRSRGTLVPRLSGHQSEIPGCRRRRTRVRREHKSATDSRKAVL